MTLSSGEAMKRPGMLLSEALERFKSLVDGHRLHPAQPLPRNATDRDFCTLFIHDCQGACRSQSGLLEFLQPYLPANHYKIRAWLPRSGLLVLLNSEETARRVKRDLEMRDPEFKVDFWAVREKKPAGAASAAQDAAVKDSKEEQEKEEEKEKEKVIPTPGTAPAVEKMQNDNAFTSLADV